jgi:NADPH:quinone reductase-like Zn-dependent oxidoreductase
MPNPKMIKAIRYHQYDGPEQLQLEEIDCPQPQTGEVLVRVYAAGVQPVDWKIRSGLFKNFRPLSFPYIPGTPLAGVVEEPGPGVIEFQTGQAVFGRTEKGTYAQYTTVPVTSLALKPTSISFEEAATLPAGATTSWWALFLNGELQSGQTILIQGAAGGVGLYAVQFAHWKGAQVIATTSTPNLEFVRALGADRVIDYTVTPFETVVQKVDMVLDTVGGETLQRSLKVVKPGGTLISIVGQPYQPQAQQFGIRATDPAQPLVVTRSMLETIAELLEAGVIKAVVGEVFPLAQAQQAHELSQSGHGRGRIVLHIPG